MAKENFDRTKPHVNIGTVGDVGYGQLLAQNLGQLKLGPSRYFPEITLSIDDDDHRDPHNHFLPEIGDEVIVGVRDNINWALNATIAQSEWESAQFHCQLTHPRSKEDWGAFVHAGTPRVDNMIGLMNVEEASQRAYVDDGIIGAVEADDDWQLPLQQIRTAAALGVKRLLLLFVSTAFSGVLVGRECGALLDQYQVPLIEKGEETRGSLGAIFNSNPIIVGGPENKAGPICVSPEALKSPELQEILLQALEDTVVQPVHPDDQALLIRGGNGGGIAVTADSDGGWGTLTVSSARLVRGVIHTGDAVHIVGLLQDETLATPPPRIRARIQRMIVHQRMDDVDDGDFCSLQAGTHFGLELEAEDEVSGELLRGIEKSDIRRGMVIVNRHQDSQDDVVDPLEYAIAFEATVYSKKKPKEIVVVGSKRRRLGNRQPVAMPDIPDTLFRGRTASIHFPLTGARAKIESIDELPVLSLQAKFDRLKATVDALEADAALFYEKGNQAAGTRVRKGMQELKNLAQDIRVDVQEIKNKGRELLKEEEEEATRFDAVRDHIHGLEAEFDTFVETKDNRAGTRVRKGMQELKTLAQGVQDEIDPEDILDFSAGVYRVILSMKVQAPVKRGLRFAIREGGRTVGAGQVTEIIE